MIKNSVRKFRQINSLEGYSYIILLFIAMPIKYIFALPLAVKIVGMAHGVLFIIFCLLLIRASLDAKWPARYTVIFFVASLIPFGTFFTKNKIKTYE